MNSRSTTCHYYHKLIGWLKISATEAAVTNIEFVRKPTNFRQPFDHPILTRVASELDNYFNGKSGVFTTPIQFMEGSEFQQMVWRELLKIPLGQTMSYGQIASSVGKPKAARAVGTANGKNPIPIIVPCHRVINSNGSLGGYSSGIELKQILLNHEKAFVQELPMEVEAKLVIISENPWDIISKLNKIDSVGKFRLGPISELHFKDFYFDMCDRSLSRRKWGFRLRRDAGGDKIALKGPGVELKDGSIERPELEMEWNGEALDYVLKLMDRIGVCVEPEWGLSHSDVFESLHSLGLAVIQERDTKRTARKIFRSLGRGPVGELVIDQVSFFVGDKPIKHFEIEIESWDRPGSKLIEKSLEFMKLNFSDSVMPWKIDKLATIQIIADLFESGKLTDLPSTGLLSRSYYETIQNQLVDES
ncbi:MAG: methylated-DNA--[protein]-cysteine S-methyltransferase [Desulfomonilaceae bacterium]